MKSLDSIAVTEEVLHKIAERHGIKFERCELLQSAGIVNSIYLLGEDYVLRIPRKNDPARVWQARREALAIPLARDAGVRTPRLVDFNDDCDLLPVPYLIVERVRGDDLESLGSEPSETTGAWRELGRDLARLHAGVREVQIADPPWVQRYEFVDPRELTDQCARNGWISPLEARWFLMWLERLAPMATRPVPKRFVHADVQMSNVMVEPESHGYLALIDCGCALRADATVDFVSMPLSAVPILLEGHREVMPLDEDETGEARILWRRIQLLLRIISIGAAPGQGDRPIAWLIDLLRFFMQPPSERWRDLSPIGRI
jgi:aminoglycoside phosphotransferase (APT) family kinase protein